MPSTPTNRKKRCVTSTSVREPSSRKRPKASDGPWCLCKGDRNCQSWRISEGGNRNGDAVGTEPAIVPAYINVGRRADRSRAGMVPTLIGRQSMTLGGQRPFPRAEPGFDRLPGQVSFFCLPEMKSRRRHTIARTTTSIISPGCRTRARCSF